ncbi:hypothetical protein NX801_15650 [Streptomyces sp. LP05-1]|uniref:Uncharacterized protein n=1 Tax=Streptomyces pyxinae TaxID=2970734 RepID=A0ABT2CI41_9ACTN|nr:hypothetical protein [Streptomyces sp. LP05-1]MCS0637070.1 hypothetical protein [Streptomyces sp. LP05-1]
MLRTVIDGEWVTLPATLGELQAALTDEERPVFEAEMNATALEDLTRVAVRWALPAEARQADEELFVRLAAGDYSGLVDSDGRPVES